MTTQMEYATVTEMLLLRMYSKAEPVHSYLTNIEQNEREYNANQFLTHHTRFLFPLLTLDKILTQALRIFITAL